MAFSNLALSPAVAQTLKMNRLTFHIESALERGPGQLEDWPQFVQFSMQTLWHLGKDGAESL